MIKDIDALSKSLEEEVAAAVGAENDPLTELLNSLSDGSDKIVFQTVQANFTRAVERHKHDESKLQQILQDWRESLLILKIILEGDEAKHPEMNLKTIEIERRLKLNLGTDYIDPLEAVGKNKKKA